MKQFTIKMNNKKEVFFNRFNNRFYFLYKSNRINQIKNKSFFIKILLLIVIAVVSLGIILYISRDKNTINEFTINNQSIAQETPALEQNLISKNITYSDFAIKNGISDANIYFFSSGTELNDTLIYNSIITAQKIGSSKNVRVFALFSRGENLNINDSPETKVMMITKTNDNTIHSQVINNLGRADITDPQVLVDYVSFVMSNFPAKRNILVIDGIGKGSTGIIYDEYTNKYLTLSNLESAISRIVYSQGLVFDTLIIHSSFGASLELLSSMPKFVKYIIATPDYLELEPLNYGLIIETVNEQHLADPQNLSRSIFSKVFKTEGCNSNRLFNLYDEKNYINIINGIETFSTAYFRKDTPEFNKEIKNSIALSQKLYASGDSLPIFNFNEILINLSSFNNPLIKSGVDELNQEIGSTILDNSCTTSKFISISLPEQFDDRIFKQTRDSSYTNILSFKELIRIIFFNNNLNKVDSISVNYDKESFYTNQKQNEQFCYSGIINADKFIILDKKLGIIEDNKYKCSSNISNFSSINNGLPIIKTKDPNVFVDNVFIKFSSFYYYGKIYFNQPNNTIKKILIENDGIHDFAIVLNTTKANYLSYYNFIDKNNQKGIVYSQGIDFLSLKNTSIQKFDIGVSYAQERQENEVLKIINNKSLDLLPTTYQYTYNIFGLSKKINPIIKDSIEISYTPSIALNPYTISFDNLDQFKSTYKFLDYQFNELIYAAKLDIDPIKKIIKPYGINFGTDIIYYKGEIIPTIENSSFWNNWIK